MSGSLNEATLIGRVGKDPEIRRTASGDPIVNLSVATSESWRDKNSGERKERTEWHRIVCFNEGLAKVIENYVKKGSLIFIRGQLQTRKWQDQSGADKYSTEIVLQRFRGELTLLDGKRDDSDGGAPRDQGSYAEKRAPAETGGGSRYGDLDDDVPFLCEWR